jgi:hypothetical protein
MITRITLTQTPKTEKRQNAKEDEESGLAPEVILFKIVKDHSWDRALIVEYPEPCRQQTSVVHGYRLGETRR